MSENAPPVLVILANWHEENGAHLPSAPDSTRQLVLGLLFGIGLGYCPGTGVAALGQGNYAAADILGLMAGSYLYAETSAYLGSTIEKIGNRGCIMLPDLLGIRLSVFLALFIPLLALGLLVMAQLAP